MNSEKVKEIKKALEDLDMICYEKTCSDKINRISNYINELENELKTCKARIAELEEGIAKSMLGCEFLPECTHDKLKQFVERAVEKVKETVNGENVDCFVSFKILLSETLKEFTEKQI